MDKDIKMTSLKTNVKESTPARNSRRSFLSRLWAGLGVIAIIEFVWVVLGYLSPDEIVQKGSKKLSIITAGPVDRFAPGSVTAFVQGKFYLCRFKDGGFLALSSQCTHLGCTIPWDEEQNKFVCPCHSSEFDIRGMVINAPAPRPLDIYPVTIINKIIKIDIAGRIRRNEFEARQMVYPSKT